MITGDRKYRIIVDTGCDLDLEEEKKWGILSVPFKIDVEDQSFVDDQDLDLGGLLRAMKESKNPIRTACPSPLEFEEALEKAKDSQGIFVFTISKALSGSYNSAQIALGVFKEKYPHIPTCLMDTESASAGQTNIAYKALDLIRQGLDFEGIREEMATFIRDMNTFFILESLDNLIKNGRIRKSAGLIASALSIKPIMRDNGQGEIELFQINRGFKKSLKKLAEFIVEEYHKKEIKMLTISHVEALDKANLLKESILAQVPIAEVRVIQTKGLASGYADMGGIVVAF